MAKFLKMPTFHIGTKCQWVTEGELHYKSDLTDELIVIPDDFATDLASIPRWVPEWLIQRNGKHRRAAVVHDWCCRTWSLDKRPLADKIFLEIMEDDDETKWRRKCMYGAVSLMTKWLQMRKKR